MDALTRAACRLASLEKNKLDLMTASRRNLLSFNGPQPSKSCPFSLQTAQGIEMLCLRRAGLFLGSVRLFRYTSTRLTNTLVSGVQSFGMTRSASGLSRVNPIDDTS